MPNNDRPSPEEPSIGYGRPPAETRFRKGQSGNPAGRRKGTRKRAKPHADRLVSLVLEEAYRPVTVKDNGREVTMPVAQAIFRSLAAAAASGEMRAQAMFLKLVSATEGEAAFFEQMLAEELERRGANGFDGPSHIRFSIVDPAPPTRGR